MIKDFFEKIAIDGKVSINELLAMVEAGVLQIRNTDDAVFSLSEIARIFNVHPRTVARWVDEGKLKAEQGVPCKVVTARELERFYKEVPIDKSQTCIYVQADSIEAVNENINRIVEQVGVNKYRCNIFADIDGDDGFRNLLRHLIVYKGMVYTNVSLIDKGEYVGVILTATNTTVQLV